MTIEDRFEEFRQETREQAHRTDDRFGGIEVRFDRVEARLDRVETRLDRLEVRLDGVERRLDAKIDGVERSLRVLIEANSADIRRLAEGIHILTDRMDRQEARAEARHTELIRHFSSILGNHELRIQALEQGRAPA